MNDRILASAVLDVIKDEGGNVALYRVTVTGAGAASGRTKVYHIREDSEDSAAMEAIHRFTEEVENDLRSGV